MDGSLDRLKWEAYQRYIIHRMVKRAVEEYYQRIREAPSEGSFFMPESR